MRNDLIVPRDLAVEINMAIVHACAEHGVLVTDVVAPARRRDRRTSRAREDAIEWIISSVEATYEHSGADACCELRRRRDNSDASPFITWRKPSQPVLAKIFNCHHTAILLAMRRIKARRAQEVVA